MNVKEYRAQVEAGLSAATNAPSRSTAVAGADAANSAASREQAWTEALAQLSDRSAPSEARRNALQVLQAGTFLGQQFDPMRARYTDALHGAITDPDSEIRHFALDVLIDNKDAVARQRLMDGLQGKIAPLLAPAAALSLLARDDHASAGTIARDLLAKSADVATRMQAVRVLGSDPGATDLIANILKDKDEFREVRRAGGVALKGLNPELFRNSAAEILGDSSDFQDIKSSVGGALERSGIALDDLK